MALRLPSAQPPTNPSAHPPANANDKKAWWQDEAQNKRLGECPITLEAFSSLSYPPFELYSNNHHNTTISYFDGFALASFIVSRGAFQNPLTRQSLTMEDCRRLDRYLEEHCYAERTTTENNTSETKQAAEFFQDDTRHTTSRKISVVEAFGLHESVRVRNSSRGSGRSVIDSDRAQALRNAATVALAGLFVWENGISGDRPNSNNSNTAATTTETTRSATDPLALDWGFDLTRQVTDTSRMGAGNSNEDEGWFTIIDDDEAIAVGSHQHAYQMVQEAFPPLHDHHPEAACATSNDYNATTTIPSRPKQIDQHLMERVRSVAEQDEEERRQYEVRLELARQQLLQQAVQRREERRRQRQAQISRGVQWYEQHQADQEEAQRARAEIEAWRDDQWEKLRVLSEMNQDREREAREREEKGRKTKKEKEELCNDIMSKEEEKKMVPENEAEQAEAKKKAKAAAKRKKAKERKKAQNAEERLVQEHIQRKKALAAKKAASTVKCNACGQGILDAGFEKFDQRFCSPKCARSAKPS